MVAANSAQLYIYAIIVETTEVVSAYVFIKYHPSMKRLNLHDILAFGVGFGIGEAFTLAWVVFLPLDLPFQGIVSFITMFERFSAVLVHLASAVFIGLYLKAKRFSDIAAGILSKDLSVATLAIPLLLTVAGVAAENAIFVTELILAAYAVFWLWMLYMRLRSTKIPEPGERAEIRLKRVAICICVYFFAYIPYMVISFLLPISESVVQSLITFITYILIVTLLFYHIARKKVRRTEAMLGGFIGTGLFQMLQNVAGALFAPDVYMQALQAGASLMTGYMYPFIGILLGLWFYEMIIKKRLKLPHT
jgi:hypothetical protein